MPLADYLAKNYLSADKPSKKRKRKNAEPGLIIADDDDSLRKTTTRDADDDDGPVMVPSAFSSGSKNLPKTTWKTFGAVAPSNSEQAAADAILADAAAESAARMEVDDEAPAIVDEDGEMTGPQMANGAMAGLQTAEQVAAALKRREKAEKKAMKDMGLDPTGKAQETIYRDASGRIINVAMKRAELRRQAEEEERKKAEELENRRGDVQRKEREARKQELEDAKHMKLSRYADDEQLNAEMKDRERWNDPAARFLSKSTGTSSKGGTAAKSGKKAYVGAFEPNRYGIRPGFRWDGVDRSIGFEKKWFDARNQQQNIKDLKYAWQMDE